MKLQIMNQRMLDYLKDEACLQKCLPKYQHFESNDWLLEECPQAPFVDTKFDMTPVALDMSAEKGKESEPEFANVKLLYSSLRFISDSNATDERLWTALCLGPYYEYVRYRWKMDNTDNVKQHFFFGYNTRRAYTRNAIARLWWIGRLTYDSARPDPWELTRYVCEHSDTIFHVIERTTSNNLHILRGFVGAMVEANQDGVNLNTDDVGNLAKYLNLLGGSYILDAMPEQWIKEKIKNRISKIVQKQNEPMTRQDGTEYYETTTVRSSSILLIENQMNGSQMRIPAKKHKYKTNPKSLVGMKVNDTFMVGTNEYRILSIRTPKK